MPPLKPGKVVSQTGKVVNSPNTTPRGGPGGKTAPKAIQKISAETAKEAKRLEAKPSKPTSRGGPGAKTQTNDSQPTKYSTPYVGHYGQQPPPPTTVIPKNGGPLLGTDKKDEESKTNPAMPPPPTPVANVTPAPVKTPTRNVTNIADLVPQFDPEYIKQILFENLSAVELSRIERHDTIEGINQRYSIISNLSEIRKKYEITKQLTVMDKFRPLTKIFTINIEDKIPKEDYIKLEGLTSTYQYLDENNEIITREKGYYFIDTNGDLVIELLNLERSQQVEIQIDTNGTIYKVES